MPKEFVEQAFAETTPEKKTLWFTDNQKKIISEILDRPSPSRTRYWQSGKRTVWILEQIGKYKPITTGFIIEDNAIQQIKVLIYRESHGWEVKYPFFTDQFIGVKLKDMQSHKLNTDIDGIAGATLSVRALVRLSRLALTLHQEVTNGAN